MPASPSPCPRWTVPTLADQVLASAVGDLARAYTDQLDTGEARELQLQAIAGALILAANWVADELLSDSPP